MRRTLGALLLGLGVASCATVESPPNPPAPAAADVVLERGTAVYYASRFHGRRTASGVRLDNAAMMAAHPSLPFGCVVRVTHASLGRSADVTIVDRGPSPRGQRRGIVIDVSQAAARELGFLHRGTALVELEIPRRCAASLAL